MQNGRQPIQFICGKCRLVLSVENLTSSTLLILTLLLLFPPSPFASDQVPVPARDARQDDFSIQTIAENGKFITTFSQTLAADYQNVSHALNDLRTYPSWLLSGINGLNNHTFYWLRENGLHWRERDGSTHFDLEYDIRYFFFRKVETLSAIVGREKDQMPGTCTLTLQTTKPTDLLLSGGGSVTASENTDSTSTTLTGEIVLEPGRFLYVLLPRRIVSSVLTSRIRQVVSNLRSRANGQI